MKNRWAKIWYVSSASVCLLISMAGAVLNQLEREQSAGLAAINGSSMASSSGITTAGMFFFLAIVFFVIWVGKELEG